MLRLQEDIKGSGDLIEDEEEYNEEEDVDFDPTKVDEGSEDEEEEENYRASHDGNRMNVDYAQIESETGGLVRTRRARQLEEEQRKRHKYETLQDVSTSEEVKDLWEDLKCQASRRLRTDISKRSVMAEVDPLDSKAAPETQILIKRDYKFAGEMVHEEKMVPISSAEAKEYLNSLKFQQDLKTGHLLGASPRAQFVAQIVGAIWSIVLSSVMYICYNKVYHIPDKQFRIPTAIVWIDCARLVTGQGLPEKALECSIILGCAFAVLSLVRNCYRDRNPKWLVYVPSGVAVGVGIYNTPSFTIARFIGGVAASLWMNSQHFNLSAKTKMIVFSSGLVLGEGICSIFNMLLTDLNIPHL